MRIHIEVDDQRGAVMIRPETEEERQKLDKLLVLLRPVGRKLVYLTSSSEEEHIFQVR